MIDRLTGTIAEVTPSHVVLDVQGVGYDLRCSSMTAAALPGEGSAGVTLFTRLVVRESAISFFGFASKEERSLFERLVAVSGVGPSLALSVLSTFTPSAFAAIVAASDTTRMATIPGVGKKLANRLVVELQGVFATDAELGGLLPLTKSVAPAAAAPTTSASIEADVTSALLSMGFSPQEAEAALDGYEKAGASTPETMLSYALRRLGGGI